jgi:hypothetical protein
MHIQPHSLLVVSAAFEAALAKSSASLQSLDGHPNAGHSGELDLSSRTARTVPITIPLVRFCTFAGALSGISHTAP